jgi:hypothetical protein
LATSLFFITFILFQPPSAAMGRWLGAKYWIPFIMVKEINWILVDLLTIGSFAGVLLLSPKRSFMAVVP